MTRDDIAAVMEREPRLDYHGLRCDSSAHGVLPADREVYFAAAKSSLLGSAYDCTRVCEWLTAIAATRKSVNPYAGSYQLKHIVEAVLQTYISNGQLIAAAIHFGLTYRTRAQSPNATFNVSEKFMRHMGPRRSWSDKRPRLNGKRAR